MAKLTKKQKAMAGKVDPNNHYGVAEAIGLVKSLAPEVAEEGVTVNALLPGYTATARIAELGVPEEDLAEHIPARRLGRPEELGAMAAFLASEQAGYVTGQAIAVDGGYLRGL